MKFYFISVVILLFAYNNLFAQEFTPWADSVITYSFGTNTNFGQAEEFFPANVIGPPDTSARLAIGSANPSEICALGLDGTITFMFTDNIIVNGSGPDFTIFENAFLQTAGSGAGSIFVEPAKVEVSLDGFNFTLFPFDSLSLNGLAGVTPTNGDSSYLDPLISGGDQFDLETIGLDSIKYIRITDVSNIILSNPNHPNYNFLINSFDLDAVVALNSKSLLTDIKEEIFTSNKSGNNSILLSPNPVSQSSAGLLRVQINNIIPEYKEISIYNVLGQRVLHKSPKYYNQGVYTENLNINKLSGGVYFLSLSGQSENRIKRFLIIK